jgi:16S rRNA (guanine527-N7)-methyltransferase
VAGVVEPLEFADDDEHEAAREVFGAALPAAGAYAALLAEQGVAWGLLGPREVDRLWSRHLINSAALAPLVPTAVEVLDIGSGAGLPGIPLRLVRPDLHITLVEPLQRRIRFLQLCCEQLQLPDVSVRAVRAEQLPPECADVVTARAVAPLQRLLPVVWPLVRPGGQFLAIKGRRAEEELARCRALPGDLRMPPDVVRRSTAQCTPLVTVVRFRRKAR